MTDSESRKVALVTGASSGIGQAIALRLASRGLAVYGTARNVSDEGEGRPFQLVRLDVRSDQSVASCVDEVVARAGRLDILVNNAGYALSGAAEETSIEEAKAQFDTNFFGAVRVVNAALPTMRKQRAGKIINIGSLIGLMGVPFMPFYAATKFALEGYSEALWHELKPLGISVSLVEPEFVHTGLTDRGSLAARRLADYDGPRQRALAAARRFVDTGIAPEEVASRVLQIVDSASPRLRYRVGADAKWLPRLKAVSPWRVFAAGVRRRFHQDASTG
jgi:NAD(P)-dependent dehydrogenase (short-subunit alcohol dehydrogenase family)